jgi:GTP 3',8-cyclase
MAVLSRVKLYKYLPLSTPFSLHVFPVHSCNFKCKYCLHSLPASKLKQIKFKKEIMRFDRFCKAIDGIKEFDARLKALIFAGHGEPLLHPKIADMVAYAKKAEIADRIEIVTNASRLTPELSDALLCAGLDRLRISLQGLDAAAYESTCGVTIDFEKFLDNIAYFYAHKNRAEVLIKIIDMALGGGKRKFHALFRPISDDLAIEYTIPFVKNLDVSELADLKNTKQGQPVKPVDVCSMPFYMLVLLPSGKVTGCCAITPPVLFGAIGDLSLKDVWDSKARSKFLLAQINDRRCNPVCRDCAVPDYGLQKGDCLDPYKKLLTPKYLL